MLGWFSREAFLAHYIKNNFVLQYDTQRVELGIAAEPEVNNLNKDKKKNNR